MRRHRSLFEQILLSTLCFVLVQACKHPSEDSDEKLVKGQLVEPDDPVASHTVSIMDPDPDIGQYCSAVLLERDILLTAAHCFNDKSRRAYALFSTSYNPKLSNKQQSLLKIRRIAVHADYSQEKGDGYDQKIQKAERLDQLVSPGKPLYDIAVASIDDKIPDAYEPAPLAGGSIDFNEGQITTAGYGCTTTICRGHSNILRKISMRFIKTYSEAGMIVLAANNHHGSCAGDSGGPDFIDQGGILRVFALIATGPSSCEAGISVDTLIDPYRGWIEQAMNAVRTGRKGSIYNLREF